MNIAELSIRYKTITWVFTVVMFVGGILAYERLGRLEDPEFTIKTAKVVTPYPGASAMEVAEEVSDRLEQAIQEMGQIDLVKSKSEPGLSIITIDIKPMYPADTLPQIWDELRRKINDTQPTLPPGAGPSNVIDDFGDVFGILYAVYGDGYTYAEIKEHADLLQRELLLVEDVGKVEITMDQPEAVYVEISNARMSQLGVEPAYVYNLLAAENLAAPAGKVEVGSMYIRTHPTGEFASVEELGDLLIQPGGPGQPSVYLRDVATIYRGYQEPSKTVMRYDGKPAITLGISTVKGGNVVNMGEAVKKRIAELEAETPIGIELGVISLQSDSVTISLQGFIISLAEAVLIVVAVLLFAMGFRSAMLIGFVLLLTVLATFIIMASQGIQLERISLGALIIALGMLVDNAIVVVEGYIINSQRGDDKITAASKIVKQTMWPLLGATFIAILAFAAIGASQDSTGEFCRSLFQVITISLLLSWLLAITVTPLLSVTFMSFKPPAEGEEVDPYGGALFRGYRRILETCIRYRWVTVVVLIVVLISSIRGFGMVKQSFFPDSTRPQFMLHYWLPQGTHIDRTSDEMAEIEKFLLAQEGITGLSSYIGGSPPRFILTFSPEDPNPAYGFMLVDVEEYEMIDAVIENASEYISANFPAAEAYGRKFVLGTGEPGKIQARFRGPDPDVLRVLGDEAFAIMVAEPTAADVQNDWRTRTPLIRPIIAERQARDLGLTRRTIADALQSTFGGRTIGLFRDGDDFLPIVARPPESERDRVGLLDTVQVWSSVAQQSIPIGQIVRGYETTWEDSIIRRRDRLPTLTIKCDPKEGEAVPVFLKIQPKVEARWKELQEEMDLTGYTMEWGGEYESSKEAQSGIMGNMPLVLVSMTLIIVVLFNSIRKPIVIFLTVPFALTGVTVGLLVMDEAFGFMAMLGLLSLVGMLMKNAIVLIDEINAQLNGGADPYDAIVMAGVSRLRPVSMAAMTTVLGMIPLLPDVFFASMAVTIMFGLSFATVLTLVVIPVLYAVLFRIPSPAR
ncbi:MAG: efflux RND transporter permease subunit [Candidatus Hydrogenedentota bacterium]